LSAEGVEFPYWENHNNLWFTHDDYRKVEAHFEPLERLMYDNILDLRSRDESRRSFE
jgi:hypothetical protein